MHDFLENCRLSFFGGLKHPLNLFYITFEFSNALFHRHFDVNSAPDLELLGCHLIADSSIWDRVVLSL